MRTSAIGRGVATWLVAFVATALVAPVRLVERTDEGWILWVMARVARGDVLYRDVYDVTTPVPAWLGAVVVRVTGSELMGLRLLVATVIATQVVTACSIARHAGVRRWGRAVLAVALVAAASPMVVFISLYTAGAVLGALLALRALLWLLDRIEEGAPTTAPLLWLGAATACSFWCKPNIGLMALAAVVVALLVAGGRAWRSSGRAVAIVVAAFAAVGVVLSTVIVATGAWSAFLDQVFRSKREYLDVGFSFTTAVDRRADALTAGDPVNARAIVWLLVLATPVVVVAVLGWACWRARGRIDARLAGFVGFGIVGVLGTVPRPGVDHIGSTLPLMVTAAVGAALSVPEHAPSRRLRHGLLVGSATLAVIAALVVVGAAIDDLSTESVVRDAAHFAATPVQRNLAARAARLKAGLDADTNGEVFIVREDAGFLYFLTGTRNPLPYDIAERSDFGADDEEGVIDRLRGGAAAWVCLVPKGSPRGTTGTLDPRMVNRWVRTHGTRTAKLPMCDLYRLATPTSAENRTRARRTPS